MSELYDRLFLLPQQNLYASGSPALVEAGALYRNARTGGLVAQLKLKNLSPKPIKAVTVTLSLADYAGRTTGETVFHRYLDLNVPRDQSFGMQTPIPIENPETRGFSVRIDEVVSQDNAVWTAPEDAAWISLPEQQAAAAYFADKALEDQYHVEHGPNANFIPQQVLDLWRCACGALNRSEESRCHGCGALFFEHTEADTDRLRAEIEAREAKVRAEIAQREAVAKAEAERQAALAQAEAERREAEAQAEAERQAALAQVQAERRAKEAEETQARRLNGAQRAGRFFVRLLCAALVAASLLVFFLLPAIQLTGKDAESVLADADFQVTDSLDFTKDVLLHSKAFDREAIEAAGVDLSEKNVVPLLVDMETTAKAFTDGDLSLAELLRAVLLAQRLTPTAEQLFSTDASYGLAGALGVLDEYPALKEGYGDGRGVKAGLIGFEALLGLLLLFGVGSVLLSLFGKRKCFDVLLLVGELLMLGLFFGAAYFGSPLLAEMVRPAQVKLSLVALATVPCLATLLVIVLKSFLLSDKKLIDRVSE